LASQLSYYTGPFKNTGPIPPVHDKETTYTIIWSTVNSSSDVSNVIVKTTLPSYVKWLSQVSPQGEDVTFNSLGGEVLWKAGDVKAGSGINSPARSVAFRVAVTPSLNQVGERPTITGDTVISGTDAFTKEILNITKKGVNTELTNDPGMKNVETATVQ
jgi:hypothetical protein